ncbi:hypothetical protein SFRURICE_017345 [Spodoptera frugiperda]|nr:hypothetical protein SFRURICE_017345 [Spodoptera frugiperda]
MELASISTDNSEFATPDIIQATQSQPTSLNINDSNSEPTTSTNTNDQNTRPIAQTTLNLSPEILEQLEQMYMEHHNRFKDSDPTTRPYIPKLKSSRKLAAITTHLNAHILPKLLTSDTDFHTLQTSIYCAAYTIAKFNGARIKESNGISNQSVESLGGKNGYNVGSVSSELISEDLLKGSFQYDLVTVVTVDRHLAGPSDSADTICKSDNSSFSKNKVNSNGQQKSLQ